MYQHRAQLRNARTTRTSESKGGQHRAPAGIRTIDGESDAERIERLRRINAELGERFDEQAARDCYTKRDAEALADFTAALEQARYGCLSGVEW